MVLFIVKGKCNTCCSLRKLLANFLELQTFLEVDTFKTDAGQDAAGLQTVPDVITQALEGYVNHPTLCPNTSGCQEYVVRQQAFQSSIHPTFLHLPVYEQAELSLIIMDGVR